MTNWQQHVEVAEEILAQVTLQMGSLGCSPSPKQLGMWNARIMMAQTHATLALAVRNQ